MVPPHFIVLDLNLSVHLVPAMLTRLFNGLTKRLGPSGEDAAAEYLKKQGYSILARNFKTKFGEVDLVAKDGKTICFVEVKTRKSLRAGFPEESVTLNKQWRLTRLALAYLKKYRLYDVPVRFDVVSILREEGGGTARIRLMKGAFEGVSV